MPWNQKGLVKMSGIILGNVPWPGLLGDDRASEKTFNDKPSDSRWYVPLLDRDPWFWDCRKNAAVCEQAAGVYHKGEGEGK